MWPKPTFVAYSRTSLAIVEVPQPGHVTELAFTVPSDSWTPTGCAPTLMPRSILPGRPLTSTHALRLVLLASQKEDSSGIFARQAGFGHTIVRAQKYTAGGGLCSSEGNTESSFGWTQSRTQAAHVIKSASREFSPEGPVRPKCCG